MVEVNPEPLAQDALHAAARGVLQPRFEVRRPQAAKQLEARLVRISTLLLSQHEAPAPDGGSEEDSLDASAAGTLRHGGDVRRLPNKDMPDGVAVAALLR